MKNEFTAYVEDGGDGWFWARCAEVPGANGQGRTPEEAIDDLGPAIETILDFLRDEAGKVMSPSATRGVVLGG